MPTATVTYTFTAGTTAVAAQVNQNFQDLLNFLNVTKLNSANIQAGGISANNLATDSVTSAAILSGAVGADEIAAGAVDTGELAVNSVTNAKLFLSTQQDVQTGNINIANTYTTLCSIPAPASGNYLVYGVCVWIGTANGVGIRLKLNVDTNARVTDHLQTAEDDYHTLQFLATAVPMNGSQPLTLQAKTTAAAGVFTSVNDADIGQTRLIAVKYN